MVIGILLIAHDTLPDSLVKAVAHVLGAVPPQFETLSVAATTRARLSEALSEPP